RTQPLNLVAQPRRLLEFEIAGGLLHPRLQIRKHRLEIVAKRRDALGKTSVDGDAVALVDGIGDVGDISLDAFGRDAVRLVPGRLLGAAAVGLGDGPLDRAGLRVSIENYPTIDVAGGAADGLDQRGFRAQEALLVGVEDGYERAFGDVEAFAQEIDADEAIEGAEPEIADDLDPLDRVNVRMHVA